MVWQEEVCIRCSS